MESYLTMQGNLVADPVQRVVAEGLRVTRFRIASSGRRWDRGSSDWVNTDPVFMSVSCWRQLGDNVFRSLHKGDTVIVVGRVVFREYDDAHGGPRRSTHEIDALAVGPDLSRYLTTMARPPRPAPDSEEAAVAAPAVPAQLEPAYAVPAA
jgi:single-strand DNA-binding protein